MSARLVGKSLRRNEIHKLWISPSKYLLITKGRNRSFTVEAPPSQAIEVGVISSEAR